jgi:hypothetical protein
VLEKQREERGWDIATKAARKLEEELELATNGIEPPKKPDHITIEAAADLYLADMVKGRMSLIMTSATGKNVSCYLLLVSRS